MTTPETLTAPVDPAVLAELGEWAALGFYEGLALPWPRAYGLAWRRLYEHLPVRVPDGHLLIPCEPFSDAWTMTSRGVWHAAGLICDFNHHSGLRVNPALAEAKRQAYPHHDAAIETLVADLGARLPHFGGYTHSNPDIRRVVDEGFLAMEAELHAELSAARAEGDEDSLPLLLALADYAAGVRAFYEQTRAALQEAAAGANGPRPAELAVILAAFERCFLVPAESFVGGLLAVNFTWMLDGCDSIGRLDQALGPLFERDLQRGTLDLTFARRLLDELWQSFERLNGWNLQLGGRRPDGADGCNALTRECLLACRRNRQRRPNVAFRITGDTPEDLLHLALEVLQEGSGRPALYNDDLYIEALQRLDLGLTPEDSREIGFGGCTETMIAGLSNVGSLEGELNLAKLLELALWDGVDPVTRERAGPPTGPFTSFATFAEFLAAVEGQIRFATDAFCERASAALARRFREGDPKLYRTFFTRDCVRRRKSFEAGGARYNWSVVTYQGIANLIDSLAAVRHCVFETGEVSAAELLDALAADFAGYEAVQRRLQAAPRFGNDDPWVDELGAEIIGFAWRELLSHRQVRGGRFLPSCIVFATYGAAGRPVGATPDGRQAGTPLNDSVGAVAGRDTHGPTALLNSVLRLPLSLAAGTPVLNLRFQRRTLSEERGRQAVAALVRSFFAGGGMQVQLSVISREEMLAAQQRPQDYADLIVRIGGYSEYFTRLDRALQDTVIARTEYAV